MKALVLRCALASVQGGLAALVVLGVCAVLRRLRAPSRVLCWLWLAVGLRFLLPGIPVTLPCPRSEPLAKAAAAVQSLTAPVTAVQNSNMLSSALPAAPTTATVNQVAAAPWYAGLTVWHVLAAVWASGTLALLLRAVLGYCRLAHRVALAYKTDDGCFTAPGVESPFTLGILRPRIFLPAGLQGPERQAVLRHERTHIARGDTVTKPLFYAIACLHWWDPLVWLALAQFERTMECACDEAAVRGLVPERRRDYGESILRFATLPRGQVPGSLAFSRGRVKERVVRVLRYRRPGRLALLGCALAALLTATACMVQPTVADAVQPLALNNAPAAPAPTAAPATMAADRTPQEMAGYFADPLPDRYAISRFAAAGHQGDDLIAGMGSHVVAAAAGVVREAGFDETLGCYILLDHPDAPGGDWASLYAHLEDTAPLVSAGDAVTAGQTLGYVGDTGEATGIMLHFALYKSDTLLPPRYFTDYGTEYALTAPDGETYETLAANLVPAAPVFAAPVQSYSRFTARFDENGHPGLDIAAPQSTPVYAVAAGTVAEAGYDTVGEQSKGNFVRLLHAGGEDWSTLYAHLDSCAVAAGDTVEAGQVIGYVGDTGYAFGDHLHLELLQNGVPVDPLDFIAFPKPDPALAGDGSAQ